MIEHTTTALGPTGQAPATTAILPGNPEYNSLTPSTLCYLAGGIVHNLNNLHSGLVGYIEMAIDAVSNNKPDQAVQSLQKSLDIFVRADQLMQQLRAFSKTVEPRCAPTDLAHLIKNVAEATCCPDVICSYFIAKNLWACLCDKGQIDLVIHAIFLNAAEAMDLKGTIKILLENLNLVEGESDIKGRSGKFIHLTVTDQGCGLVPADIPFIFDPFYSTKKEHQGLGLAIAHSIVKRHNGWIDVESAPGSGATFHVYLPSVLETGNIEKLPPIPAADQQGMSALIMDDEEMMRDVMQEILSDLGYSVVCAKEGNEALRYFSEAEKSGNPFDVTILDLGIAIGMGGRETVFNIRKINPSAFIFVAGGYSDDPIIADPKRSGFNGRIIKPFRKAELIALLETMPKVKQ